ncbi:MAG: sel1 repeat family protein [Alphaproteobacteria bacterium]|nr:sel1 repeat family protein [Alphaproteobacteria bacterium]
MAEIVSRRKNFARGQADSTGGKLLQIAARQGSRSVHFALAQMYSNNSVPLNPEAINPQSLMLFHLRLTAEGRHTKAQTTLTMLYQNEDGVATESRTRSARYYTTAAQGGIVQAQYNLGLIPRAPRGQNPTILNEPQDCGSRPATKARRRRRHDSAGCYIPAKASHKISNAPSNFGKKPAKTVSGWPIRGLWTLHV